MDQDIRNFTVQWLRVALAAFVPVAVTAFVSIPLNLGTIPGEQAVRVAAGERHMT